jgi:hypothetical protein
MVSIKSVVGRTAWMLSSFASGNVFSAMCGTMQMPMPATTQLRIAGALCTNDRSHPQGVLTAELRAPG